MKRLLIFAATGLIALASVVLIVLGCNRHPKPPIPPEAAKLQELAQTVDSQRVALIQAQLALKQAESVAPNKSDPAVAKADADLLKEISQLQAEIKALADQFKLVNNATIPPPQSAPLPTTDPTQPVPSTPSPNPPPTPSPNPTQDVANKSKNSRDAADKAMMQAVAAALCVAQPEICPFAAMLGEIFGAFGTPEERDNFVKTMSKVAEGQPLSADDVNSLTKSLQNHFNDLPPDAIGLYQRFAALPGGDPLKAVIDSEVHTLLDSQPPNVKALVGTIQQGLQGQGANPVDYQAIANSVRDSLQNRSFPSTEAKRATLDAAAGIGAPKELLAALDLIPPPLPDPSPRQ